MTEREQIAEIVDLIHRTDSEWVSQGEWLEVEEAARRILALPALAALRPSESREREAARLIAECANRPEGALWMLSAAARIDALYRGPAARLCDAGVDIGDAIAAEHRAFERGVASVRAAPPSAPPCAICGPAHLCYCGPSAPQEEREGTATALGREGSGEDPDIERLRECCRRLSTTQAQKDALNRAILRLTQPAPPSVPPVTEGDR